jgi:hypothetical protein
MVASSWRRVRVQHRKPCLGSGKREFEPMTLEELHKSIDELNSIRSSLKPRKILQIEMLWQDLNDHYLTPYKDLPNHCRKAFDEAVKRRLAGFLPMPTSERASFSKFVADWGTRASSVSLQIHFGQMRVGPDFQGQAGGNVHQQAVVGLPDELVGRPLTVVSGSIHAQTILPDQMPIHIFWAQRLQKWICANNRGYTAFCRAGVRPLRLIPREGTTDEINRLSEQEGVGNIGTFTYPPGYGGAHLGAHPRVLPSWEMPITTGPNTWVVQEVITVPIAWR